MLGASCPRCSSLTQALERFRGMPLMLKSLKNFHLSVMSLHMELTPPSPLNIMPYGLDPGREVGDLFSRTL